jgi:CRISPR-associated DxTHG motif protein
MIVLSFLGLGTYDKESKMYRYEETTYTWGERESHTSTMFAAALTRWFPEAEVVILETKEANQANGQTARALMPNAEFIPIPNGRSDEENWEIFNAITKRLPDGENLILDVTHGFRSMPVLATLVVSFLRAAKNITLEHLVYAAFERGNEITPVFDLTPFVTMLDWANATNRFLETGDARKLKPLIRENRAAPLNKVADKLEKLSVAITLNRTTEIADLAHGVTDEIRRSRNASWGMHHEPFKLLLDQIEHSTAPLGIPKLTNEMPATDVLISQYNLILWYAKRDHYAQAIALAREWMVSVQVWKHSGHYSTDKTERKTSEDKLGELATSLRSSNTVQDEWREFIAVWNDLYQLRNDIAHFGMNEHPTPTTKLPGNIKTALKRLRAAVQPLGLELPEFEP